MLSWLNDIFKLHFIPGAWNEKRAEYCSFMSAFSWLFLLCIMCFVFSVLAPQTHFPWVHEHMASYCNSYNNITSAAARSDDFCSNQLYLGILAVCHYERLIQD